MLISEVSSLTSWAGDVRKTVMTETFKYDKGNDVTVVTVHSQKYEQFYGEKGKEVSHEIKGSNIDIRV